MENKSYGFKELYDCILKATYPMEIGDRKIKAGEPICFFNNLELINFKEIKSQTYAKGGKNNPPLVAWEKTLGEEIAFEKGIMSRTHLALLGNAVLKNKLKTIVPKIEEKESDENGNITLSNIPIENSIYVYNKENFNPVVFTVDGNILKCETPYLETIIYYDFLYEDASTIYIGKSLINGFVEFVAKTRFKDDETGKIKTGIFRAKKVKLISDFSITAGDSASPVIGNFSLMAYPPDTQGKESPFELTFLNEDVDEIFN